MIDGEGGCPTTTTLIAGVTTRGSSGRPKASRGAASLHELAVQVESSAKMEEDLQVCFSSVKSKVKVLTAAGESVDCEKATSLVHRPPPLSKAAEAAAEKMKELLLKQLMLCDDGSVNDCGMLSGGLSAGCMTTNPQQVAAMCEDSGAVGSAETVSCMQGVCVNDPMKENRWIAQVFSPIAEVEEEEHQGGHAGLIHNSNEVERAGSGHVMAGSCPLSQRNAAAPFNFENAIPSKEELGNCDAYEHAIQLDDERVIAKLKRFEAALVGQHFGRRLPYLHLSEGLRDGSVLGLSDWFLSAGSFICFFDTVDRRDVVMNGPRTVAGQVVGIDKW